VLYRIMGRVLNRFDPWRGKLCTCPPKYSYSPYVGCSHACRYCYITAYIKDAFKPRPKKRVIDRLLRDVQFLPKLPVAVSTSSEPYMPMERRFELTRRSLEVLVRFGFPILIVTKSSMVVRDIDILRRGDIVVSITITTVSGEVARRLEPGAPSPEERLKAVKILLENRIKTTVRIDPLIPSINVEGVEKLVRRLSEIGVGHITSSTYKAKRDSFHRVVEAFPEKEDILHKFYWGRGRWIGRSRYLEDEMRRNILKRVREACSENGMSFATCREGNVIEWLGRCSCDSSHLLSWRLESI